MTNTNHRQTVWLALLATLLLAFIPKSQAQETDDLQAYLDELATKQQTPPMKKSPRKAGEVTIPVGLTEVDLTKFTSYQNRTKQLTLKASVKFTGGTITAASNYSGGDCLLKVYGGATVVLDATAGIDAGSASAANCLAAVGIYEGSKFYQCGNITGTAAGTGVAVYLDTSADAYYYVSGTLKGTVSNENHGTVVGIDEDYQFKDGETFTAPTVENVTMTFQVISAAEKTCRVGIGSAAAIATSTQGVVTIPDKVKGLTVTTISNRAFKECQALTRVVIPATVTTIGSTDFASAMGAFHGCSSITSFSLPSSLTLIGRGTFSGCVSLTEIKLPSSLTTLGSNAFDGCSALKSVELSPNIKSIELETFRYCKSLQSIVIPAAVSSLGNSAFAGCNSLTTVTSLVTSPFAFGQGVFANYNARLYVPAGTKTAYQSTACWNRFAHIYTIGSNEEQEDLLAQLVAIGQRIDALSARLDEATTTAATVKTALGSSEQTAAVEATLAQLRQSLESLRGTCNTLSTKVKSAQTSELATLQSQTDELQQKVSSWEASLQALIENTMATVVNYVQAEVSATATALAALQTDVLSNSQRVATIAGQTGTDFFMRQPTEAFSAQLAQVKASVDADAKQAASLVGTFNSTFNGVTISTVDQALALYASYQSIVKDLTALQSQVAATGTDADTLSAAFATLPVCFPDEELSWSLRPGGLQDELQMGYKSNRGFVLTSAGMMYFEQVSGATFHLRDADDNYLVAVGGTSALRTGTKAEATLWTGQSLGNGSYTFHSDMPQAYLGYSGIQVNSAIATSATSAYAWQIEEGLDEGQAFFNLLAELEEENKGGGSDLAPTDTLYVTVPTFPTGGHVPTRPYVFPTVPYPVYVTGDGDGGYWTLPAPKPGQARPSDYHPISIPKGSHVIIDDVTFYDIVGGDHVIYVEGTVEININVLIHITNWEWFVHVGPGGKVIWRCTGGDSKPRIKNEGTMNIYAHVDYILNRGTLNHYQGTVTNVMNRYVYYFYGGVVNLLWNYGQHYHQGGTALTARNFEGATYTMTGGEIRNTVVSQTDTVFVNRGTFYFRGGTIGGYGSRLVYHGPGATMYIDGGHFDFTYVLHYWIEAHNYFYIRGDYNYAATVPILLAPSVTIRLLYDWTYRFNIQFIGGLPTSHYPLFWADNFTLTRTHYVYIGWPLPGSRWRWHLDETANAIEPRGEEVEDEDDLQAYLDWLADHQDDDAASSEEQPQQLDLKGRTISINKPVELPAGQHVTFINGTFKPASAWTQSRMFYIPATTSVRLERTVIDFSSSVHYVSGSQTMLRYLFEVFGTLYIGTGTQIKGYYNTAWQVSDNNLKGSIIRIDPQARLYLTGGSLVNVVLCLNSVVNIYVTNTIVNNVYVYVPTSYRKAGFRLMAPWSNYHLTLADLRRIILIGTTDWGVDFGTDGHASLFDLKNMGDVNLDGRVDVADVETAIGIIVGKKSPTVRADMNLDGRVSTADFSSILQKATAK